jgi:hypothetical protein
MDVFDAHPQALSLVIDTVGRWRAVSVQQTYVAV